MIKKTPVITVKIKNEVVGRLALSPEGLAVFEYEKEWIENGFSVSPFYLPLKQGVFVSRPQPFQGNFGIFADSLPDGWGNLLLDRLLKKYQINHYTISILERLGLVGSQGMGALCYEPEQSFSQKYIKADLEFLASEARKVLNDETDSNSLELLHQQAASSAGARPKVMIKHKNEYWLVKFPSSTDSATIGEIEYRYSLLAHKVGLEMPETKLFEGKYFGVKRFDRTGEERHHIHSATGLLNADFRLPSLDYTELIKACRGLTRNAEEVEKIFRLMVFNVLIGNKDDHAKNFSFIYTDGKWKFTPVYDVLPSNGFNGNHSTTIAGQGKPEKKDILKVAAISSISEKKALQIYEEVADQIKNP
jgi:serine/threonine-protein kinase HipA